MIERLAAELGLADWRALSGWRRRGRVPLRHRAKLLEAARARGLNLEPAAFDRFEIRFNRYGRRDGDMPRCPTCGSLLRYSHIDNSIDKPALDNQPNRKKGRHAARSQACCVGVAA